MVADRANGGISLFFDSFDCGAPRIRARCATAIRIWAFGIGAAWNAPTNIYRSHTDLHAQMRIAALYSLGETERLDRVRLD